MAEFRRTVKVTEKELKEAAKSSAAADLLTQRYSENLRDPVKTSIFTSKDLENYQESRKALKRKAEAKAWEPSKPEPWKYTPRDEFNGGLGRKGKSGA